MVLKILKKRKSHRKTKQKFGFGKNLDIAKKLLYGFLLVSSIAAVVGVVGIAGLWSMGQADKKLYEEGSAPLIDLTDAINTVNNMRIQLRDAVVYTDYPRSVSDYETNFNTLYAHGDEALQAYAASIRDADTRALCEEAVDLYHNTLQATGEELFAAAKTGSFIQARNAGHKYEKDIESMLDKLNQCAEMQVDSTRQYSSTNATLSKVLIVVMFLVVLGGIAAAIFLGRYISKMISRPIREMVSAAQELAEGNVEIDVQATSKDEIGVLANAFHQMIGSIREQVQVVNALANKDLTVQFAPRSPKDTMGIALAQTLTDLNAMFAEIRLATGQVSLGAEQVASGAQALSQGATEQASAIETLSMSITDVSERVEQTAENVQQVTSYVEQAVDGVGQGNQQMHYMLESMNRITQSSHEIANIIKVIDDIAFQTNILALNAAVEAARAGVAGKGFAVVADEVRNLASKSADAAKQTTKLIEDSIRAVQEGKKLADDTAVTLEQVEEKARKVKDSVQNIRTAALEQATTIHNITEGIEQVSDVVQMNSATAQQSAAASEELSGQANMLQGHVGEFRLRESPN